MSGSLSERRLAENEVYFRQMNERMNKQVQEGFNELNTMAQEMGDRHVYYLDEDMPLFFYCECSDESCQERVEASLGDYSKIHRDTKAFIIVCGHEVNKIEYIVSQESNYCVVKKYEEPPETAEKLNSIAVKE